MIAYFRGESSLRSRFLEFAPLQLPWVVLGELHFGAQRAKRRQEQLAHISDLLTYSVVLLPDQATTEHYGQIKAELAQSGRPIPDNDLWIAALARQHDLPLATRDTHFSAIPQLTILGWCEGTRSALPRLRITAVTRSARTLVRIRHPWKVPPPAR